MRDFDFDDYEKRCETTKEIKEFLKEHPMCYNSLLRYARENNKDEWKRALRSHGCSWLSKYCIDGYFY